jgi:hypothetical protein
LSGVAVMKPVPSINSSALKKMSFSDTARLDELFDHTTINGLQK